MSKRTLTLAAVATLLTACSGSGPTGPTAPTPHNLAPSFQLGTPGSPNCRGQTTKAVAQGEVEGLPGHGIGGVAREAGADVQVLQAAIVLFCAGT
jgi:hypothetical protein